MIGGIIVVLAIIVTIGLTVISENSEKLDVDDQSVNKEPYVPKKITLELSDGISMGEAP